MMILPTFLKWAGGKRRLISQIDPYLPKTVDRYIEPFLGGGAMFFYIKQKYSPKFCLISDINKDLIDTYIVVRDNPDQLIKYLRYFKKNNSKDFYYKIRKDFNLNKILGAKRCAAFIYLNKTCFNGLYRVNSKNEFNVPYGKYKNPEIFNEKTIKHASDLLKGTLILYQDYELTKNIIQKGDFVYLDPCYDPINKTSFAQYTPKRFNDEDNEKLANYMAYLRERGAKTMLSNNITQNVKRLYPQEKGFDWIKVSCPRSINSIGMGRGNISELLIVNFLP